MTTPNLWRVNERSLEQLSLGPDPGTTLPAWIYSCPSLYRLEQEAVFKETWQVVGRAEEVVRPGDFFTTELQGEPLVVCRDREGRLRCHYNVCRHRAGQVACGKGNRKVLQCSYHGWTYGLDGCLLKAREFDHVDDFDLDDFRLHSLSIRQWGPLLLVHPTADPNLESFLGEIVTETAHLDLANKRLVERRDYVVQCNWKVYVENYLEGYHIPMAHPGLYRELDSAKYRVETRRFHSRQWAPLRPVATEGPPRRYTPLEADESVLYYWVYPNLMLNFYPDNLQVNLILPLGVDQTLTVFEWYFDEDGSGEAWEAVQQSIAFSDEVQREDIEICEAVQKGLNSKGYLQGRFHPQRENGVHHFQSLWLESVKARQEDLQAPSTQP